MPYAAIRMEVLGCIKDLKKIEIDYIEECGYDKLVVRLIQTTTMKEHAAKKGTSINRDEIKDINQLILKISALDCIDIVTKIKKEDP